MIRTKTEMKYECENCPYFELENKQTTIWSGTEYITEVTITCAKRDMCDHIMTRALEGC